MSSCLSGQLLLGSLDQAFCPGWNSGLRVASLPQEEGAEHGNTGRLPTAHQSPSAPAPPEEHAGWAGRGQGTGGWKEPSEAPTPQTLTTRLRLQGSEQGGSTSGPPL